MIFTIILSTSCTKLTPINFFHQKHNFQTKKDLTKKKVTNKKKSKCTNKKLTIISDDQINNQKFYNFLKKEKKLNSSITEKFLQLALFQLRTLPHLTGVESTTYIISKINGKFNYYQFTFDPENLTTPFITALRYFSKENNKGKQFFKIINSFNKKNTPIFKVSKNLAHFLSKNVADLSKSSSFKDKFFKGKSILQFKESIHYLNVRSLNLKTLVNKEAIPSTHLFSYNLPNRTDVNIECNQDLHLYDHSIFLISKNFIQSNNFGLKDNKGNFVMAVTTQDTQSFKSYNNSFLFKNNKNDNRIAFCKIKESNQSIYLFSTIGRDPAQHLYRFILNLYNKKTLNKSLESIQEKSRSIFLTTPLRHLFESERSNQLQITQLRELNIPIYHVKSLGKIWGLQSSKRKIKASFISDPRHLSNPICKTRK